MWFLQFYYFINFHSIFSYHWQFQGTKLMSLYVELGRNKHNWFSQAGVIWLQHTMAVVFSLQLPNVKQGTILSNFLILSHPGSLLWSEQTQKRNNDPCSERVPSLYRENRQRDRNLLCTKISAVRGMSTGC